MKPAPTSAKTEPTIVKVDKQQDKIDTQALAENRSRKVLEYFDLTDRVFIVSGGGRGLGLTMAEGLAELGGQVYCLDRLETPHEDFEKASQELEPSTGGKLKYERVDITNTEYLNQVVSRIADKHQRLDGVIAAAGIQQTTPAIDYTPEDVKKMLDVNYTGVFMTAQAAARAMMKYKCRGSICLIASMSGIIANKGLISPVYNSSKAAVIQLAKNLAMEWGHYLGEGHGGIRVNALCPGHIETPMAQQNMNETPGLREKWQDENMMHRLSNPEEFKCSGVFLLSDASSFMTGAPLLVDGGHSAW